MPQIQNIKIICITINHIHEYNLNTFSLIFKLYLVMEVSCMKSMLLDYKYDFQVN